jgi:hypothetical protein
MHLDLSGPLSRKKIGVFPFKLSKIGLDKSKRIVAPVTRGGRAAARARTCRLLLLGSGAGQPRQGATGDVAGRAPPARVVY